MDEVERKSVMLDVLYEDKDVLVVVKPAGIESQTSRRLEPDMVSEIKNYLHRKAQEAKKLSTGLSPKASTVTVEPVCWSYPPAGQAGARRDGVCQEPEGGSALEPSGTRTENWRKSIRLWYVENLWIMWVSTWIIC